jgi:hypothetical protein
MANRFDHLFHVEDSEEQDVVAQAKAAFSEVKKASLKAKRAYDAHIEKAKNTTLFEALTAMGINDETKSRGGYPAVTVGDPEKKVQTAPIGKSAINALLAIGSGKYKELEPYVHTAYFDPLRDAPGVRMVYSPTLDQWVCYDWSRKDGDFVASDSIRKGGREENHYNAKVNKHDAITEYLIAKEFETPWQIVLWSEDLVNHYQEKVHSRKELTLPEVWDLIAADWNDAETAQQISGGGTTKKRAIPVSNDRKEFVEKLAKCSDDQVVTYTTSASTKEQTLLFPASDDKRKAQFLQGVLNARPGTEFIRFERAPEVE